MKLSPDFKIRRYSFFIDGWFPQFSPARASQSAKPDPGLTQLTSWADLKGLLNPGEKPPSCS
jgi:hypothetical protein